MAAKLRTIARTLLPPPERLVDRVRAYLIRHCTAGGRVSEVELSKALGRPPRSAIQRVLSVLEGEGLVTVEARAGTRAVIIPREDIVALLKIRRAVETDICLSLARNGQRDLRRAKEIAVALTQIASIPRPSDEDRYRFNEFDCAFHESLALAAENAPAAALLRNIRAKLALVAIAALRSSEEMHDVITEHAAIIAGIEKKSKDAADKAIEAAIFLHLANTAKRWYPQLSRSPE